MIRDKDHRIKKLNERIAIQEGIVDDRKQLESDLDREKKAHAVTKVLCDFLYPRCIFSDTCLSRPSRSWKTVSKRQRCRRHSNSHFFRYM